MIINNSSVFFYILLLMLYVIYVKHVMPFFSLKPFLVLFFFSSSSQVFTDGSHNISFILFRSQVIGILYKKE